MGHPSGEEEGIFSARTGGGGNNSGEDGRAQQDPNNTEEPPRNEENVPAEIVCMLERTADGINGDDEDVVRNILCGMVDDGNQPLLEHIPTAEEENEGNNMQFFSEWEHSGSCYYSLREDARTRQELISRLMSSQQCNNCLKSFFSNHLLLEQSSHR